MVMWVNLSDAVLESTRGGWLQDKPGDQNDNRNQTLKQNDNTC